MAKTITVKGVGKATVKPDQVEIRMTLSTKDKVYEKSMSMAAEQVHSLKTAFEKAGFGEGSLRPPTLTSALSMTLSAIEIGTMSVFSPVMNVPTT